MPLQDIPDDILDLVADRADMATLRCMSLAGRRLLPLATKRLFCQVQVLSHEQSLEKSRNILKDPRLNPMVKRISLVPGEQDENEQFDSDDEAEAEEKLHGYPAQEDFKRFVQQIGQFTNLREVEIVFSAECAAPFQHAGRHFIQCNEVSQPFAMRNDMLQTLFEPLTSPENNIQTLSIRHLQDIVDPVLVEKQSFKDALARLRNLSLKIATEYNEHSPESTLQWPESHLFFEKDLKQHWLRPVQDNLTHLKLYADIYWGYVPHCDLRDLFFPKLKSLALGNMSFVWDWQLEWILSHKTLESLVLDDCPIIHAGLIYAKAGLERDPPGKEGIYGYTSENEVEWRYESRWHDYFERIRTELPNLRHFACGHGPWEQGEAFQYSDQLKASLATNRYAIFDNGTGPTQWIEPENNWATGGKLGYSCAWEDCPSYPMCEEKDRKALERLMDHVGWQPYPV